MRKRKEANLEAQAPTSSGEESLTPQEGNLDFMLDGLAAQAPETQPGVIAAYNADEAGAADVPTEPATKRGRPRKPESELKEPRRVKVPKKPDPNTPPPVDPIATNQATAEVFTTLKEQVTIAVIGSEWQLSATEKALETHFLAKSLDRYAPEGMEVNPLVMYASISVMHAAKRFSQPETQTWWARTKTKAAAWWLSRKVKKEAKYAAYANRGTDAKRENHAGDSTGGENQGQPPADNS